MSRRTCALLVLAGVLMFLRGAYIPVKAAAAQVLLNSAWEKTLNVGGEHRPWPWADTHPVARLSAPEHDVELIALAGAAGNSLAFGPGHVASSGVPGSRDTVILGGHRDTHFRFLEDVRPGDRLILQNADGLEVTYRVEKTEVTDSRVARLRIEQDSDMLALVTCYPFDALRAGGPLRYVVSARTAELSL